MPREPSVPEDFDRRRLGAALEPEGEQQGEQVEGLTVRPALKRASFCCATFTQKSREGATSLRERSRVKLHHVLEAHGGNGRVIGVSHFDAVVQPEVTLKNFGGSHVSRSRYRVLPSSVSGWEFFPLWVERDRVVVEVEKEARHGAENVRLGAPLLRLFSAAVKQSRPGASRIGAATLELLEVDKNKHRRTRDERSRTC